VVYGMIVLLVVVGRSLAGYIKPTTYLLNELYNLTLRDVIFIGYRPKITARLGT